MSQNLQCNKNASKYVQYFGHDANVFKNDQLYSFFTRAQFEK